MHEEWAAAEARAREIEEQMTDDERFALIVSVMGASQFIAERDERIPEGTPMSAGYVPGVPRLGVPALLMSDASLGIANPGYRPGDTPTALRIVIGTSVVSLITIPLWVRFGIKFVGL